MIQLDPLYLTALISVGVPLLVALITKRYTTSLVKTLVNLAASAIVAGLTTALATDGLVEPKAWVMGILVAFGTSLIAHYNLWRPTGVSARVQGLFPDVGIGEQQNPLTKILASINQLPGVEVISAGPLLDALSHPVEWSYVAGNAETFTVDGIADGDDVPPSDEYISQDPQSPGGRL